MVRRKGSALSNSRVPGAEMMAVNDCCISGSNEAHNVAASIGAFAVPGAGISVAAISEGSNVSNARPKLGRRNSVKDIAGMDLSCVGDQSFNEPTQVKVESVGMVCSLAVDKATRSDETVVGLAK